MWSLFVIDCCHSNTYPCSTFTWSHSIFFKQPQVIWIFFACRCLHWYPWKRMSCNGVPSRDKIDFTYFISFIKFIIFDVNAFRLNKILKKKRFFSCKEFRLSRNISKTMISCACWFKFIHWNFIHEMILFLTCFPIQLSLLQRKIATKKFL